MAKLTLEELRALRDENRTAMDLRDGSNKDTRVIVSMGTCGIAAGAKETFTAFVEEIAAKKLVNVLVQQSGCMGLCKDEPTVEVVVPGMDAVIYGKVDAAAAKEIVAQHVMGKKAIDAKVCARPAENG